MFRADDMGYALKYLGNMFGILKPIPEKFIYSTTYYIDNVEIITLIVAILCALPIFNKILEVKNKFLGCVINIWLLILLIFSTATIAANSYNPFIYFRF